MKYPLVQTLALNQYEIFTDVGVYFQSYQTIIAFIPFKGPVQLDAEKWDYSKTTSKYLNQVLRMDKKAILAAIKSGIIVLAELN